MSETFDPFPPDDDPEGRTPVENEGDDAAVDENGDDL